MFVVGLIVGLFGGAIIGFITFALCVAAHEADEHLSEEHNHNDPHP